MEIKDGRITPTSQREVKVFSRLLREQEAACDRSPDNATSSELGQELSGFDSYKLFSAIERAVKAPESRVTSQEEKAVFGVVVRGLAMAHLESLQLERLKDEAVSLFSEASNSEVAIRIMDFASHALTDRYG